MFFCACHPVPCNDLFSTVYILAVCTRLSKKSCFVTKFGREEERASSTVSSQFWKDVEEDDSASRPGGPARNDGGMENIANLKRGGQFRCLVTVVDG